MLADFVRFVYIPLLHRPDPDKTVRDLASMPKLPHEEITIVVEVGAERRQSAQRMVAQLTRFCRIIEKSADPSSLNLYFSTEYLSPAQQTQAETALQLLADSPRRKLYFSHLAPSQKLQLEKSKTTPLVLVFSSYPTISGLPPHFLVGAELAFNPPLLKATDYDLFTSFRQYATSEQRKGK